VAADNVSSMCQPASHGCFLSHLQVHGLAQLSPFASLVTSYSCCLFLLFVCYKGNQNTSCCCYSDMVGVHTLRFVGRLLYLRSCSTSFWRILSFTGATVHYTPSGSTSMSTVFTTSELLSSCFTPLLFWQLSHVKTKLAEFFSSSVANISNTNLQICHTVWTHIRVRTSC
jgi:hypothetical protein